MATTKVGINTFVINSDPDSEPLNKSKDTDKNQDFDYARFSKEFKKIFSDSRGSTTRSFNKSFETYTKELSKEKTQLEVLATLKSINEKIDKQEKEKTHAAARAISTQKQTVGHATSNTLFRALNDFGRKLEELGKGFGNKNPIGGLLGSVASSLGLGGGPIVGTLLKGITKAFQLPKYIFNLTAGVALKVLGKTITGAATVMARTLGKGIASGATRLAGGALLASIPIIGWGLDIVSIASLFWTHIRDSLYDAAKNSKIGTYVVGWLDQTITPISNFFDTMTEIIVDEITGKKVDLGAKFNSMLGNVVDSTLGFIGGLVGHVTKYPVLTNNTKQGSTATISELVALGFTPIAAAGIAGNLNVESRFDPNAENASGHRGIAQWDTTRQGNFNKWAKTQPDINHDFVVNGKIAATKQEQERFLWAEYKGLDTQSAAAFNALQNAKTPQEAALIHERAFERSGSADLAERTGGAVSFYDAYNAELAANTRATIDNTISLGGKTPADQKQSVTTPSVFNRRIGAPIFAGDPTKESVWDLTKQGTQANIDFLSTVNKTNDEANNKYNPYVNKGASTGWSTLKKFFNGDYGSSSLIPEAHAEGNMPRFIQAARTSVKKINTKISTTPSIQSSNVENKSSPQDSSYSTGIGISLGQDSLPYNVDLVSRVMGLHT